MRKFSVRQSTKPGPDTRQRSHKAAGAQQASAGQAACGQIAVELLLIYFVHVQKSVFRPLGEGRILDVFAKHACALLLAASEEVHAMVTMGLRRAFVVLLGIEIVWHRFLLYRLLIHKEKLVDDRHRALPRASARIIPHDIRVPRVSRPWHGTRPMGHPFSNLPLHPPLTLRRLQY